MKKEPFHVATESNVHSQERLLDQENAIYEAAQGDEYGLFERLIAEINSSLKWEEQRQGVLRS